MKRLGIVSAVVGLMLLGVMGWQSNVQAGWSPDVKSGDTVTLEKSKTHEGSMYIAGGTVKVEGTVKGSLYCAGQNVTISGKVEGDVLCAGQTVEYAGEAQGSVRLAGQQVNMNGMAATDTTLLGQVVYVGEKAKLSGDLNGGAQTLVINGVVAKNLQYGAQSIALNNTVAGTANVSADTITLGDDGKIVGSLHYSAAKELDIDTDKVAGSVEYNAMKQQEEVNPLATILTVALMFIVTSLLIALIIPRFMERSSSLASAQFGMTLLVGAAAVFVTPFLIVLLFVGVLSVPLAMIVLFLYLAMLLLSGTFFAYFLGASLLRSSQNVLVRMVGGMAVFVALMIIPIVNIFAFIAAGIVGSGILIRALTHGYRAPRYSLAPEPPRPPMPGAIRDEKLETPKPIAKKPTRSKKPTDKDKKS